ncbi:unnamed protein product [Didymodactylos carnosus]|uniref:Uncharacterized protein n=1 Tax=Didymodactylos carnosus TaxID=1234261 RepID=A0A8S2I0A6_9BILA|nr:unnamed protein product [Didymodactylos carnosus]CAF3695177.1 unnamed protein product [Didymodactylos carnosus]
MSAILSDTDNFQRQPNGLTYLPYNDIIDDNPFLDNGISEEISKLSNIPLLIVENNQNTYSHNLPQTDIPSLSSNHSISSIITDNNNNALSVQTSNSLGDLSSTPLLDGGGCPPLESPTPSSTVEHPIQQSRSFPSTSSTTTTTDSLSTSSSHSSSDQKKTNYILIEPSLEITSEDQQDKQQQQVLPPVIKSKAPSPPSSKCDIITQKSLPQNSTGDYQQQQECFLPTRSSYYEPQKDEINEMVYSSVETRIATPPRRREISHRHGSADRLYHLEREQQRQSEYMNRSSSSAFYPLNYANVRRTTTFSGGGTHYNEQQQQMIINSLEHELHLTKEQLNSTIRSIKTYWSPELKKERLIRKDEQLKRSKQADNQDFYVQTLETQLHQLHDELEQYRQHRCPVQGSIVHQQHQDVVQATDQTSLIETLKNNEKNLKDKLDQFHNDIHVKENECTTLKAKVDTYESKERDLQHYITILKESIMIKDQQVTMVQSEVNDLRTRLKEKDSVIESKNLKIQSTRLERQQSDADLIESKQQLDIKDRKINLLNRKIENLEEQVKDKVSQIANTRAKLTNTYQTQQNQLFNSTLMPHLEQTLQDKERQIEKLREQKHTLDVEHQDELEQIQKILNDTREKLEQKEKDYYEGQSQIIELKEQLNNTKSQLTRRELLLQTLEGSLNDKYEEYKKRFNKEQQTRQQQQTTQDRKDLEKLILENKTLQEQLQTFELERNQTQREIEWMQLELNETKIKEENIEQQQEQEQEEQMKKQQQRIEELEEAVRESLQITTEREYAMAQQRRKLENLEKQIKTLQTEVDRLREENHEQRHLLTQCHHDLNERKKDYEARIEEHIKQLDNAFISQQEKLLGELSEKDSQIADLEMDPQAHRIQINKLNGEKHQLHNQLKELTEIRMKIIQNHMAAKELDEKEHSLSYPPPYDADGISY